MPRRLRRWHSGETEVGGDFGNDCSNAMQRGVLRVIAGLERLGGKGVDGFGNARACDSRADCAAVAHYGAATRNDEKVDRHTLE